MINTFHYPPDLMALLIDAIAVLFRGKKDVLLFFKGAGAPGALLSDLARTVNRDPDSIKKTDIARKVLTKLNERDDDVALRVRREVLKRVVEFESFSTCWPDDELKAKGLVAEIRHIVNVKDSFTRMNVEREEERTRHRAAQDAKLAEKQLRSTNISAVKKDLFSLFAEQDVRKRGKALEGVLNRLFEASGILVREAFTRQGLEGEGVVEQIDGVIEIDGTLYLVEMKWHEQPLGRDDLASHVVRVFGRGGQARGIFISYSDYSQPAVMICREAIEHGGIIVLCKLEEFVRLLDQQDDPDVKDLLRQKIRTAIIDKKPLHPMHNP